MKNIPDYLLTLILLLALPLSLIFATVDKQIYKFEHTSQSGSQFIQYPDPSVTPNETVLPGNETPITPTLETTATITLEPFPTLTLIFPIQSISPTYSATIIATQEPEKGILLPMISSNNPPVRKSLIYYGVIFFWFVLIIFAVIIAREIYQLWTER
jgi:hypothetical protein